MFTQVIRTSRLSGKTSTMILPISQDEFDACNERWANGVMIQDAFPMLTADEREFILTGITPEEWDAAFGGDEVEYEHPHWIPTEEA